MNEYSVSVEQDCFEYIIKSGEIFTNNLPIIIYIYKMEKKMTLSWIFDALNNEITWKYWK